MGSQPHNHIDPNAGLGLTAFILTCVSNVLAWLSEPSNMALVNHTIGTVAGILAAILTIIRIRDYYKRRKQ